MTGCVGSFVGAAVDEQGRVGLCAFRLCKPERAATPLALSCSTGSADSIQDGARPVHNFYPGPADDPGRHTPPPPTASASARGSRTRRRPSTSVRTTAGGSARNTSAPSGSSRERAEVGRPASAVWPRAARSATASRTRARGSRGIPAPQRCPLWAREDFQRLRVAPPSGDAPLAEANGRPSTPPVRQLPERARCEVGVRAAKRGEPLARDARLVEHQPAVGEALLEPADRVPSNFGSSAFACARTSISV